MALAGEQNVSSDPLHMSPLGTDVVVLDMNNFTNPVEQPGAADGMTGPWRGREESGGRCGRAGRLLPILLWSLYCLSL